MPDIGSSQNVQTTQDSPQIKGNVGQNGEKYPDNEVSNTLNFLLFAYSFALLAKIIENFRSMPIIVGNYQIQF